MAKQLTIRVSHDEAFELLSNMKKQSAKGKTSKLYDTIANAYVRKLRTPSKRHLNFALSAGVTNAEVMRMIIHVISVLTGIPESQILPTSKLADLGLTPTKKEQLRKSINRYIVDHGSAKFISAAELAAAKTVQDLYDLTMKKL